MAHEQLGLLAGEVDTRSVRRFFDVDGRVDSERRGELLQELDNRCGMRSVHGHDSRAAASLLLPPTRFSRRSAGGLTVRIVGGPII